MSVVFAYSFASKPAQVRNGFDQRHRNCAGDGNYFFRCVKLRSNYDKNKCEILENMCNFTEIDKDSLLD